MTNTSAGNYAQVNGINMYYEIHGEGQPLVLIHGGGSTIEVTFGQIMPFLIDSYKVIAIELQAHGRTDDREGPETFEQDADDVAELIKQIGVGKAHIFGFSNGASTALQVAIRHPEVVDKLIAASTFYKREGIYPQFWEFMSQAASLDNMPQPLKDAYLKVKNDPEGLARMHNKDRDRMVNFTDWDAELIKGIAAPTLLISADADIIKPEHVVEMYRMLQNGKLVILPGQHGEYLGEAIMSKPGSAIPKITAEIVKEFIG